MKAAVICSKGLGDGLMMMVASYNLLLKGYSVTTFQDSLHQLQSYFPNQYFAKKEIITSLDKYDLIILQNDNSPFAFDLIKRYRDKIHTLYANYEKDKHPPLDPRDRVFDRGLPLVTNIGLSMASILGNVDPIIENGMVVPKDLGYRKHAKRVMIHPTSTSPSRTWSRDKFLKVAKKLTKKGYEVQFSLSPDEKKLWEGIPFETPEFKSLTDLAAHLYESHFLIGNESGTGHLASNLGIPTLIVASCPKQMRLWRPGFLLGKVVTPPSYIPNIKLLRLRKNHWQSFISPNHVIHAFNEAEK